MSHRRRNRRVPRLRGPRPAMQRHGGRSGSGSKSKSRSKSRSGSRH